MSIGVVLVGHPQRHAQVGVGAQAVLDHAGRALGGQDQVQAQGPAAGGDVHHAVDELRHLGGEGRELVHDDDQVRRRVRVRFALEFQQVLGLLPVQQPLPVVQLGPQRGQRAAHQVRGEVGDQAHGVRQVQAVRERGAALVVDEQEAHPVRAVGRGHAHHPGLQELGLAGAGGAADEGVRALVLEVEVERFDALGAHQGPERAVVLAVGHGGGPDRVVFGPAFGHGRRVVQEVLADQGRVGDGARQVGVVLQRLADVDHRREHPGQLGGEPGVEAFAAHREGVPAEPDLAGGGAVVAVDRHEVPARGRKLLHRGRPPTSRARRSPGPARGPG